MRHSRSVSGGLRLAAAFVLATVAVPVDAQEPASGFAGLQVQPADVTIRQALGAEPKFGGIMVRDIAAAGPGEAAGLRRGDLLLGVQGVELTGLAQLVAFMKATKPAQTVKFQVWRHGAVHEKTMQLTSWPAGWDIPKASKAVIPKLGVAVEALTSEIRSALGVRWGRTGLLVSAVTEDSPAERAGLRQGDRIVAVGRVPVVDPSMFDQILMNAGPDWYLLVERGHEVLLLGPGAEPPPRVVAGGGALVASMPDGPYLMDRTVEGPDLPIGSRLDALPESEPEPAAAEVVLDQVGLTVASLTAEVRAEYGARWSSRGAMIVAVDQGSASQLAGLRVGQVVTQVNQQPVEDPAGLQEALAAVRRSHAVLLVENDAGYALLTLALTPAAAAPQPPPASFQWSTGSGKGG